MAEVSEHRMAVIRGIFEKFDSQGCGRVDATDLKGAYQAHLHPKVIAGEMSEDEVLLEFLTNFSDEQRDGTIAWAEWCAYWGNVSARVPVDEHFCQLMMQAWKC